MYSNWKLIYKIYFRLLVSFSLIFTITLVSCRRYNDDFIPENAEWYSGGAHTFFDYTTTGFDHAFNDLSEQEEFVHEVGDRAFDATFVTAPAPLNSGLGPLFNNVSCVSCHVNDGRGRPPLPGEPLKSMLFRLSIPGQGAHGEPKPVPGFGGQLQPRSIAGKQAEANVSITYQIVVGNYEDGTTYELRKPTYQLVNAYMSIGNDVMVSPRIAPPVFGLGLLEAISESDIMKKADPNDANGDGISGKANIVWDVMSQTFQLGRFGWKAGQPSLLQQSAGAYNEDMGVTNYVFPVENSFDQVQWDGLMDDAELTDSLLDAVTFYMQTLGVPARRDVNNPVVREGKRLFMQIQCGSCHTESYVTGIDMAFPQASNQRIFPYTDLLLHDMGEGLADNRPEFQANGYEWRTPALWGIGLTRKVNGHEFFLHDGRARNLTEAILWHGGEAENSANLFKKLNAEERKAVIRFLESL